MEAEDTVRSKMGLVLCLRDMGNGTSRLFFDDVQADSVTCPAAWRPDWTGQSFVATQEPCSA